MKRIAIIGGGISGLCAAFTLEQHRRAGVPLEYVMYESTSRLGGVISTELVDKCVVEAGPDSFLTEKPWAADLCRELGLGDQLIGSDDDERKTYILVKGRLRPMPDGLIFMVPTRMLPAVFSRLFSPLTKLRMLREWFYQPYLSSKDESVAEFVERHYGNELVDRLADPLLSGVYGGEASQLSVRAVLPRFVQMEASHGSLGRAILAAQKKAAHSATATPRPLFTSLKRGMQQMVDALAARLPPSSIRLATPVQQLGSEENGWMISASSGQEHFDSLIIATPAHAAAKLLLSAARELANELRSIQYSSSVTLTMGYDRSVRSSLPPGFGFLVPRSEGKRLLAATLVHNKFPQRAPEDRALIRCFLGGSRDEEILQLPEDEIIRIARQELREILGVSAEPLFARIYKWKAAMAQYTVGHLDRLERIDRLRQQIPGLALAGNAYRGIGVPACVHSGMQAAEQLLSYMGLAGSAPGLSAARAKS
ncbi:MAG TPA: protoporphyrinogen oxidase [Terriglobales bacterium]|nr:protoporphyrinogen oxidase [Terriglobales bacterium]